MIYCTIHTEHRVARPTQSRALTEGVVVRQLPHFVSVVQVAELCRRAYIGLLELGHRATRTDLDGWARGSYADVLHASAVVGVVHHVEALRMLVEGQEVWQVALACVSVKSAARAADDVRGRRAGKGSSLVVRATDRFGGMGFAPVTSGDQPLAARAVGLVLADYLTQPRQLVERARDNDDVSSLEVPPSRPSGIRLKRFDTLRGLGP